MMGLDIFYRPANRSKTNCGLNELVDVQRYVLACRYPCGILPEFVSASTERVSAEREEGEREALSKDEGENGIHFSGQDVRS